MMANFDTFNTCSIKRETAMEVALQAERGSVRTENPEELPKRTLCSPLVH